MLEETIESASENGFVYVSVMDFQPVTRYLCREGAVCPPYEQFYWPSLLHALLGAATGKGADVRLLVSKWWYDSEDAAASTAASTSSAPERASDPST